MRRLAIALRKIENRRFSVLAGMPIPAKYQTIQAVKQLNDTYGEGAVQMVDLALPKTLPGIMTSQFDIVAALTAEVASLKGQLAEQVNVIEDQRQRITELESDWSRTDRGITETALSMGAAPEFKPAEAKPVTFPPFDSSI